MCYYCRLLLGFVTGNHVHLKNNWYFNHISGCHACSSAIHLLILIWAHQGINSNISLIHLQLFLIVNYSNTRNTCVQLWILNISLTRTWKFTLYIPHNENQLCDNRERRRWDRGSAPRTIPNPNWPSETNLKPNAHSATAISQTKGAGQDQQISLVSHFLGVNRNTPRGLENTHIHPAINQL